MSVHIQPIVYTVRLYPEGGGYPGPFIGVATVQLIGPETIYVSALHGTISRRHIREMGEFFKSVGIKFVLTQRHGRIKQQTIENYTK